MTDFKIGKKWIIKVNTEMWNAYMKSKQRNLYSSSSTESWSVLLSSVLVTYSNCRVHYRAVSPVLCTWLLALCGVISGRREEYGTMHAPNDMSQPPPYTPNPDMLDPEQQMNDDSFKSGYGFGFNETSIRKGNHLRTYDLCVLWEK